MPTGHPPLLAQVATALSLLLRQLLLQLQLQLVPPRQHLLHAQLQPQRLPLQHQHLAQLLQLCHPQQPPKSLSQLTLSLTSTSLS